MHLKLLYLIQFLLLSISHIVKWFKRAISRYWKTKHSLCSVEGKRILIFSPGLHQGSNDVLYHLFEKLKTSSWKWEEIGGHNNGDFPFVWDLS